MCAHFYTYTDMIKVELTYLQKEKLKVILKKVALFLVDSIICAIGGIIAGIIMSRGYEFLKAPGPILQATIVGIIIQFVSMELLGGYKFIVKYSDTYYNVRLMFIFGLNFIAQTAILGGVMGGTKEDYVTSLAFSFLQTIITFGFIVISRFSYQIINVDKNFFFKYKVRQKEICSAKRILILGAGLTGKRVLASLLDAKHLYLPVGFLDDDEAKQGMLMDNVPILGKIDSLDMIVEKYDVDKIIIAITSTSLKNKREIISNSLSTGKEVNIVPNIADLVANADFVSLLRNVKIEDLLQREEISFSTDEINEFIKDRVCLITGGGGSIGSELCRQISKFSPEKIIILDVYENGAFSIAGELKSEYGEALDVQIEIFSVVDELALADLFSREKIDIIFHAAAHKHVPLMEHNPAEAVKNNITGTWNIAKLAAEFKVKKMILVSTDKAVNPTNVMGATKRFCEKTLNYFESIAKDTTYAMVRFGNVLGSNGSVFHIFNKQIEKGGPVKVTHKDIIRYFMTIPEAVSLILQSAVYAKGGEVFVLDMGEPIKIVSLAENMIRLAGYKPYKDIGIEFTGLRPGEKLFEELLMSEEGIKTTANEKIYIGTQSYEVDTNLKSAYKELTEVAKTNNSSAVVQALATAVETYKPDERYHLASGALSEIDMLAKRRK